MELKQVLVVKFGRYYICRIDKNGIRCGSCKRGFVGTKRGEQCSTKNCLAVTAQSSWQ
jgi:hypothetical protein